MLHINLRNHRKVLITDGRVAFTGGMNIGDRHLAERLDNPDRVVDTHFRIQGPVVAQLQKVFLESWAFTTRRETEDFPADLSEAGTAMCRTIVEGPDEDLDKLLNVLLLAVSAAREQIAIMTPYFVPPRELVGALKGAALRGVEVVVVVPGRNNLPFVHWASRNMMWELLQRGVRVYLQPPPFVHTKLLMVDRHYVQVGSANIDPRSLRLNFELVVEVYDRPLAAEIDAHFESARRTSREITLEELDSRPLTARTRDALAWLLTPYL
jgi:cardiolipin synthase